MIVEASLEYLISPHLDLLFLFILMLSLRAYFDAFS